MFRSLAALAVTLTALSTVQANLVVPPLHAGAGKKADPAGSAKSTQKVIDQIKTDLDKVHDRLSADDPGAETREGQMRILKGLDDLLKQKDPNRPKNPPSSSSPPPMGSREPKSPPMGNEPKPQPKPATNEPTPKPMPAQAKERPAGTQSKPVAGSNTTPPNIPNDVRKEPTIDGPWPTLPARHRALMDAVGRDRCIPNYQEILIEYYRNLAQSSRGTND
jgi:hypothetical protein